MFSIHAVARKMSLVLVVVNQCVPWVWRYVHPNPSSYIHICFCGPRWFFHPLASLYFRRLARKFKPIKWGKLKKILLSAFLSRDLFCVCIQRDFKWETTPRIFHRKIFSEMVVVGSEFCLLLRWFMWTFFSHHSDFSSPSVALYLDSPMNVEGEREKWWKFMVLFALRWCFHF
jgi:hypothetical protein